MKKSILAIITTLLVACSVDNESKQIANDNFQEKNIQQAMFKSLATGGINVPIQDSNYQLPTINITNIEKVDIRPPIAPLAIIKNSVAQFDRDRAFIAYSLEQKQVYSIHQIERLLREQNISFKKQGNQIVTDWVKSERLDEVGNVKIRYQIDQVINSQISALVIQVLEMMRDDIIFTPTLVDKRRYASEELNLLVGQLDSTYQQQKDMLLNHN